MLNSVLITIFVSLGIVLGLIYNKFVIKDYPDYKRKFGYFITVLVFLVLTLMLSVIVSINSGLNSTINVYSVKLEQFVKDNSPENEFVKNGLDLKVINNDISQINESVDELESLLPTYKELGVNKTIYDLLVSYAIMELKKRLTVMNYSAKMINSFSDKNNVLTVSSITNGLRINATKLVNSISLIIIAILLIAFLVYIIYTLTIVRRERKFKKV